MSLLLFLTHYIRFYNIKPAADLRVTSYCDNSSLLEAEEEFHTRDVNSSSWYLNPDHDVIMTLSEVRAFRFISRHVNSHQDDERDFADLTRPEQLYRCHVPGPWRHRFLIHLHGHLPETKTAADVPA
jgi:hypothetical protein